MATVFLTGATGVLGRGTVAQLLEAGHAVRALARNADRAPAIAALGAEPLVDIYDVESMTTAVSGSDAVLHLATRIPPMAQMWKAAAWAENSALREVGTRALVDAALACGVPRVIAESITFIYGDGGSQWIDERSPVAATPGLLPVITLENEVARFTGAAGDGVGIALRFGSFYGPDARSTDEYLTLARRRVAPVLGSAAGYVSSIHTRDAASAVVAALRAPAGVYNVVDDVPLTHRGYADAFARAFGLQRLRLAPPAIVRFPGGGAVRPLVRSQRVRNTAFRQATGWAPEVPSAVDGWSGIAAAHKEASRA
jgi:nucleoside-diphosphate-sugar epimerase